VRSVDDYDPRGRGVHDRREWRAVSAIVHLANVQEVDAPHMVPVKRFSVTLHNAFNIDSDKSDKRLLRNVVGCPTTKTPTLDDNVVPNIVSVATNNNSGRGGGA
jgi:hypothetical protein